MEKAVAREDEIADDDEKAAPSSAAAAAAAAPSAKKRKTAAVDAAESSSGAATCDDVAINILARLPARTAVACTALSKRHRRLIRSPEFRSLHRRLAPPLPRPHVAFVATAPIRRRPDQKNPVSGFVGFHVAGAGAAAATPMRSLAGRRYLDLKHVNTCNGIVLLATDTEWYSAGRCRCVLWNPAVADVVEEVVVPDPPPGSEYRVLGLGYGRRSETYKLLMSQKVTKAQKRGDDRTEYWLATYALSDGEKQKQPTKLSTGRDVEISREGSLYIDGRIYLIIRNNSAILAFDVDEETVTSIDVPIKREKKKKKKEEEEDWYLRTSKLMEMSGRPCLMAEYGPDTAVWLLSEDHQWDRRCLIGELSCSEGMYLSSVKGVWDCDGVLVVYKEGLGDTHSLLLYNVTANKMFKAELHQDLALPEWSEFSDYALCWGYRPTLVSPSSIVSKRNQDKERCRDDCSTDMMKALRPVIEQDRRKGQEVTLDTVCFMDFLVRIMQKLPKDLQQVLETAAIDSEDPDFSFENVPFAD